MDLQQLDEILTRLCVTINGSIVGSSTYHISSGDLVYASIQFEEYRSIRTVPIPKTEDLSHIYWSLAYQSINEGILELQKAKEIYKQFNNIEA